MNDIVVLRLPALHCTPLTEAELRGELRGLSGDGAMIRGGFQRLAKLGKIKYFGGGVMFAILQFLRIWAQSQDFSSLEWMVTLSCVPFLNVTESFLQILIQDEVCQVCPKRLWGKERERSVRPHYALNMCISILHPCCVGLIIRKKGHTPANLLSLVLNQAHFRRDTF